MCRLGFAAFFTATLMGCATSHKSFHHIYAGMTKADVVEMFGNPQRVSRVKGHDTWTYVLKDELGTSEKSVVFKDGLVVGTTDPKRERQLESELEQKTPQIVPK